MGPLYKKSKSFNKNLIWLVICAIQNIIGQSPFKINERVVSLETFADIEIYFYSIMAAL